jgi:cellobiose-specific phosphotransferase system component IIA
MSKNEPVMNSELEESVFQIISKAGDAKSDAMIALRSVKEGNYSEARNLLKEAGRKLEDASEVHIKLLSNSAKNPNASTHFLIVHAEDHYSTASFAHSFLSEIIDVFEVMDPRKK